MNILDKIKINNIEYVCVQILIIEGREIYKVYNLETNEDKFIEETYEIVKDDKTLKQIYVLTRPKTDINIEQE